MSHYWCTPWWSPAPKSVRGYRKSLLLLFVPYWILETLHGRRKSIGAIFIDFRKAFDSICQEILFYKMQSCGISCKLLESWTAIYPTGSNSYCWMEYKLWCPSRFTTRPQVVLNLCKWLSRKHNRRWTSSLCRRPHNLCYWRQPRWGMNDNFIYTPLKTSV